jgi:hypothetical protein
MRHLCKTLTLMALFLAGCGGGEGSLDAAFRDHPELGAPFLFAALMDQYGPEPGMSEATWEEIARKASSEAFRWGIMGATLSDFDREAFVALMEEITAEVQGG